MLKAHSCIWNHHQSSAIFLGFHICRDLQSTGFKFLKGRKYKKGQWLNNIFVISIIKGAKQGFKFCLPSDMRRVSF